MSRGFLKIKQNRGILDILAEVVYNRKTRKCLRQTGTSPWWKPDGCHKHKTLGQERLALKTVSRLLGQTAHFFLSYKYSTRDTILAIEPKAPRTVNNAEVICILPPRDRFPARAVYTPPFRSRGMTGNRLLPHTVYIRRKKLDLDGGLPLMFYYTAFCRFIYRFFACSQRLFSWVRKSVRETFAFR